MATSVDGRLVYKGFEAWIVVEQETLPVFKVEYNDATREATAWIPSEAGKRFRVFYRRTFEDPNGYWTRLFLDGHGADMRMHENREGKKIMEVKRMTCIETGPTKARVFLFNSVSFTDDDEYLDDPSSLSVGEIKLMFFPANAGNNKRLKKSKFGDIQLTETQKIHERSKFKVVHQVRLSEDVDCNGMEPTLLPVEVVGEPVTFVFKYRSLDMLRADGIAPTPALSANEREDREHNRTPSADKLEEETLEVERELALLRDGASEAEGSTTPHPSALVEKSEEEEEDKVLPQQGTPVPTKVKKIEEDHIVDSSSGVKREGGDRESESEDEDEGKVEDVDDKIVKREQILMAELAEIRKQKSVRKNTDASRRPKKKAKVKAETKPIIHLTSGEIIDLTQEEEHVVRPKKSVKRERKGPRRVHEEVIDLT